MQAPRSVAVSVAGVVVVLARRSDGRGRGMRELAQDLRAASRRSREPGTATIAIGGPCQRPADYAAALSATREALEVMLKLGRRGGVIGDAEELGPYGLLLQASSRDELEAFARTTLAPILEHDRRHRTELATTLRIYLEEDRVQRRTATRTYTHVNTVAYRVGRIEQLLGRSLGRSVDGLRRDACPADPRRGRRTPRPPARDPSTISASMRRARSRRSRGPWRAASP